VTGTAHAFRPSKLLALRSLLLVREFKINTTNTMKIGGSRRASSASILSLPDEMLLAIAEFISSQEDLANCLLANRRLYLVFRESLLQRNIKFNYSSALVWAVARNYVELVCRMVRLGADLWTPYKTYEFGCEVLETPLQRAVKDGNLRLVKILTGNEVLKPIKNLKSGIWKMDIWVRDPLRLALDKKDESIARVLMNHLSEINGVIAVDIDTQEKKTALHMACYNRLLETARYLLSRGADPNWQEENHPQCFHYIKDLLTIQDTFQRRLNESAFKILLLLFTYGFEPDNDLEKIGSEHSDPRVRWLFYKWYLRTMKYQPTPDIVETDPSSTMMEFFPPLNASCPAVHEEAIQRWKDFYEMKRHGHWKTAGSQYMHSGVPAAKCTELETFPPLSSSSPHNKSVPLERWTSFERRSACPKHGFSQLPKSIFNTSHSSIEKKGNRQKVQWKKLQL
jgi:hypothetical protein